MYHHQHRLRRVATLVLLSIALVGTGCAMARMREQVRSGLLKRGIHQQAFMDEWGMPLRAGTIAGEESMQADGAGEAGSSRGAGARLRCGRTGLLVTSS
jgi:hypothetical protein